MQGRRVVITGATGGAGPRVAERWIEAGASVLAVGSSEQSVGDLKARLGDRCDTLAADATTAEGAASIMRAAGEPDTLIHLVGGFAMGPIDGQHAARDWEHMMAVNLTSSFHCFRAILPSLRRRGEGWIVGCTSKTVASPPAQMAAYTASKAGLEALARSMAAELAPERIHVNLLSISTIDTPANRAAMGDANAGKWITPDDLAEATLYLCRSGAINGATLELHGLS